jgi:hypothetical protein
MFMHYVLASPEEREAMVELNDRRPLLPPNMHPLSPTPSTTRWEKKEWGRSGACKCKTIVYYCRLLEDSRKENHHISREFDINPQITLVGENFSCCITLHLESQRVAFWRVDLLPSRSRKFGTVVWRVLPLFAVAHGRRDRAGGQDRDDLATLPSMPTALGMLLLPSIQFWMGQKWKWGYGSMPCIFSAFLAKCMCTPFQFGWIHSNLVKLDQGVPDLQVVGLVFYTLQVWD